MLQIDCLVLGGYQVNCYIVRPEGSDHCVVIDPGFEPETILRFLQEQELTVDAILLTHGHFDHVGAVMELLEKTGCKLLMHKKDWIVTGNPVAAWIFPLAGRDLKGLEFCAEGDVLSLAGLTFTALETPGHTKGSVCYRCEDVLFTGDTLFDGSCGRTDLPGGNQDSLGLSLKRLKKLPENYRIFPGHGSSSTLDVQRRSNPYLR